MVEVSTTRNSNQLQWEQFYLNTRCRPPLPHINEAISAFGLKPGNALDLGCGSGVDTRHLAKLGFFVDAVDVRGGAISATSESCKGLTMKTWLCDARHMVFPSHHYVIAVAWQVFPFLGATCFQGVLDRTIRSLKPGGALILATLGPEDDWAQSSMDMLFLDLQSLRDALPPATAQNFVERRFRGCDASGKSKHWHVIDGIVQAPLA